MHVPGGNIKKCCMSFILVALTHFIAFFVFLLYSLGTVNNLKLHPHSPAGLAKHWPRLVFALCTCIVPMRADLWALNSHLSQPCSPKPAGEAVRNAQPHKGSDAQVTAGCPGRIVNNVCSPMAKLWSQRVITCVIECK